MLKKESWNKWESCVLEVFTMAVKRLISMTSLPDDENEITFELYKLLIDSKMKWEINKQRQLKGEPFLHAPNQPGPEDKKKLPHHNKIPEFIWRYTDYKNRTPRNYTIECKRLNQDKNNRYCRDYIVKGIIRFIDREWSYGYGCESGLMIAYVQGSGLESLLGGVNHHAQNRKISPLKQQGGWKKRGVSRLENVLNRPDPSFPIFRLVHLWADLR